MWPFFRGGCNWKSDCISIHGSIHLIHCFFFYRNVNDQPPQPTILFKSNRHHRGSIYCVAWSAAGDIIATGSNDKSIKMTRFDAETCSLTWPGMDLSIHNGTVRDLAFVSRASGTPVLVSGGAGTEGLLFTV